MVFNPLALPQAKGHLNRASQGINPIEVEDEQEEEQECLFNAIQFDTDLAATVDTTDVDMKGDENSSKTTPSDKEPFAKLTVDLEQLKANFERASSQYIVESTRRDYERYFNDFLRFCETIGFVESAQVLRLEFEKGYIQADVPTWIAYWIMDKCDKIDLVTGEITPLAARPGYGTAQKMRASMSHKFGREYGRGNQVWCESPVQPGTYIGNPSLSTTVSQYMIHDGEVVTSARAIDEHILKKLYDFNMDEERFPKDLNDDAPRKRGKSAEGWVANRSLRLMLTLMYLIAFLCLLRFDEVLRIRWEFIKLEPLPGGAFRLKISLPFRKTHQTGEIAPFYLYINLTKPWLCALNLYCEFSEITHTLDGFMFRKKLGGTFSQQPADRMSADSFLQCFRNNLLDIGEDPRPFGTHSFRRGGCQYLAVTLRWPLRDVCTWGGWAENFDNPGTIFKYLLSFADTPTVAREDYFNPNRAKAQACAYCHRTCWCSSDKPVREQKNEYESHQQRGDCLPEASARKLKGTQMPKFREEPRPFTAQRQVASTKTPTELAQPVCLRVTTRKEAPTREKQTHSAPQTADRHMYIETKLSSWHWWLSGT
ncbi:hypothetical protein NM688_g7757 [Phlebia brevispora]|uniref:Uncharacterized protein n=1 Tax=Phlebia brevispora TaxID=194682 RepID=A0ACC1S1F7_9APHY|nr:hypothetical protein NM688_g7757 [Phlebia brevispora]